MLVLRLILYTSKRKRRCKILYLCKPRCFFAIHKQMFLEDEGFVHNAIWECEWQKQYDENEAVIQFVNQEKLSNHLILVRLFLADAPNLSNGLSHCLDRYVCLYIKKRTANILNEDTKKKHRCLMEYSTITLEYLLFRRTILLHQN